MKTAKDFKSPDGHDQEQIETILVDRFSVEIEDPISEIWTFYDTFDWRLFNKLLVMKHSNENTHLLTLSSDENILLCSNSAPPRFAWDLPEGSSRNHLVQIIKARALLRLAECQVKSQTYRILNKDDKTVARLLYTEAQSSDEGENAAFGSYLTIVPVRGYPKYARQLVRRLTLGAPVSSMPAEIYFMTLEVNGRAPGSYSNKLDLSLEPEMRADEAMKLILRRLLEMMRANEAGIRADVDVEFLHDFRVAVRKTRSALSQVKKVFPEHTTAHYRHDFRWLGQITSDLRDLDVYLLAEPAYRAMLPEAIRDDVTPLFDYLKIRRTQALLEVIDGLNSQKYATNVADWETFLNQSVSEEYAGANAAVPIVKLARKRIYRKYCRIIKDGTYILTHTEDELLHALRLECKKLRYLLEFFASIFPAKKVARLIKQLKLLLDYLGDFSDLSVQQEYLMHLTTELPVNHADTRGALVATGFLVATMAESQQTVKADFAQTFAAFASPANQDQYRKLFAAKGKGKSS